MAVDKGPDGYLYSVQYRSQQGRDAHDRGEHGDEATTRHRAAQNPDDSVIDNANHDRLCRTGCRSLPELHIQDLVRDRNSLISRWTISLLKDHLIGHGFAQRSLLLANPQSPHACGG